MTSATMKARFIVICLAYCLCLRVGAQGFVNLDFEDAQVVLNDPDYGYLDWSLAVPGWSHNDGLDTSIVYYRNSHLGESQRYLLVDWQSPEAAPGALEGDYSLYLAGGISGPTGPYVNAFIAQTGTIPADARSIRLLAGGVCRVLVNDTEVPLLSLGGDSYGGDISAFAGSVAELKILDTSRPVPGEALVGVTLDAITFSPSAVPEPAAITVFCLGTLALLVVRVRKGDWRSGRYFGRRTWPCFTPLKTAGRSRLCCWTDYSWRVSLDRTRGCPVDSFPFPARHDRLFAAGRHTVPRRARKEPGKLRISPSVLTFLPRPGRRAGVGRAGKRICEAKRLGPGFLNGFVLPWFCLNAAGQERGALRHCHGEPKRSAP
jgi:hypothetical protein